MDQGSGFHEEQRLNAASRKLTLPQGLGIIVIMLLPVPAFFGWDQLDAHFSRWSLMQFNTGIGLLLAALSTAFLSLENRKPSKILTSVVLMLGLATLAEHFAGIDLGIDQLFSKGTTIYDGP
jgi:hypothetical protein